MGMQVVENKNFQNMLIEPISSTDVTAKMSTTTRTTLRHNAHN